MPSVIFLDNNTKPSSLKDLASRPGILYVKNSNVEKPGLRESSCNTLNECLVPTTKGTQISLMVNAKTLAHCRNMSIETTESVRMIKQSDQNKTH